MFHQAFGVNLENNIEAVDSRVQLEEVGEEKAEAAPEPMAVEGA